MDLAQKLRNKIFPKKKTKKNTIIRSNFTQKKNMSDLKKIILGTFWDLFAIQILKQELPNFWPLNCWNIMQKSEKLYALL